MRSGVVVVNPISVTDGYGNPIGVTRRNNVNRLLSDQVLFDSAGHPIGVLLDGSVYRLQVEASLKPGTTVSLGPTATNPQNLVRGFCTNGGSSNLLVDGDPTPVVFTFNADSTDDIYLTEIRFVFSDLEIAMDGKSFGSENDLDNGVLLQVTSDGNTSTLANIQINEDFGTFNSPGGITYDRGGPEDFLAAGIHLGGSVVLKAGTADNVKITIRDDINDTSHKYFKCIVYGTKEA